MNGHDAPGRAAESTAGAVVRARFAPSPTGPLHVGSVRTALLNWLFVHSRAAGPGSTLLLRIDDTDRERSDPAYERAILADLRWLGLEWDEGPVRQSERAARHAEALAQLPTVRREGAYVFEGRVIARADGSPLYNLAAAVDDLDDRITHVLRGRDHLPNTELQSAIIRALGGEPPVYVHAALLTLPAGAKISKRDATTDSLARAPGVATPGGRAPRPGEPVGGEGAAGVGGPSIPVTVAALREQGYPPTAICNALALSLADFGTEELMLTLEEQARRFDLSRLHTGDSRFDVEKLRWLSGRHIRAMRAEDLRAELAARLGYEPGDVEVEAARTAGATLEECARAVRELVSPPPPDAVAVELASTPEAAAARTVLADLARRPPADLEEAEALFERVKDELRARDVKLGPALRGLRASLTGRAEGPELPYVLAVLTPERLARIRAAA